MSARRLRTWRDSHTFWLPASPLYETSTRSQGTPFTLIPMSQISLYAIKPRFVARLDAVVVSCASRGVGPNTVTLAAVPIAIAAALALVAGTRWPTVWVAIAPLMLVLMSVNAVDGALARRTGRSTPRGAVINELVDRFGDLAVLIPGFVLAPAWTVTAAVVATLLAETVALVSWGAIGRRGLVGVMGKPDRALTIAAGALAAVALGPAPFFYAYLTIAVGSSIATVQRTAWVVRHAD